MVTATVTTTASLSFVLRNLRRLFSDLPAKAWLGLSVDRGVRAIMLWAHLRTWGLWGHLCISSTSIIHTSVVPQGSAYNRPCRRVHTFIHAFPLYLRLAKDLCHGTADRFALDDGPRAGMRHEFSLWPENMRWRASKDTFSRVNCKRSWPVVVIWNCCGPK